MVHIKDAYYFSHDSNARSDPKIMALLNSYGMEGYGRWWVIVEMLREQCNYKLPNEEWVFDALAMAMLCDANSTKKLIDDCVDRFKLLQRDDNYIWSNSLLRRMEKREEEREKKVEAGRKGAEKRWKDGTAKALPRQRQSTAIAEDSKESKGKESKVNKKPSSSKVFDDDSPEITLANKLKDLILQNNPKAKTPDDLQKWAHDIDKMIRIDGREFLEINRIIEFSQNDNFWMSNILSARKLREQYDQLYLQMKKRRPQEAGRLGVPPSKSVLGPRED